MRTLKRTWLMGLATTALSLACGGGNGTGPSPETLTGTWQATKAEMVSQANPATKVDLVALGGQVRLVLTGSKTFTLTVSMPGDPDEITTGSWSSSVDLLTLAYASGAWQFSMTLSGDPLTLSGADAEYDFNDDGQDEPAKINLVMVRGQ